MQQMTPSILGLLELIGRHMTVCSTSYTTLTVIQQNSGTLIHHGCAMLCHFHLTHRL